MNDDSRPSPSETARQSDAVAAAVRTAVRQALLEHKQSGDPIVVWENGAVRWIPADEIVIPDE